MKIRARGGNPVMEAPTEVALRLLSQGATLYSLREKHVPMRQNLGRKARVLAVVHGWMPYLAAGSERMLQHMLDSLPRDEFEIAVLSLGFGDDRYRQVPYDYEGLTIYSGYEAPIAPDIIVTHHGPSSRVVQGLAQDFPEARVVAVFHNDRYDIDDILGLNAEINVFNTQWVKESLEHPGMVIHPPLEFERHLVEETGSAVTLVNLQDNKGVGVFYALAERMPDVRFLGVEGTHGQQIFRKLPNVELFPVTQDMREVWRKSRIVLMPSAYESYGMVAAEAQVNGIPVIANPTPGLTECLGHAGIFIPRENVDDYERTIRLLLEDHKHYQERSDMARLRGLELEAQTKKELAGFVDGMRGLS